MIEKFVGACRQVASEFLDHHTSKYVILKYVILVSPMIAKFAPVPSREH